MKTTIIVQDAGMLTTVQDAGRIGFQKFGIPVSGVMDEESFRDANCLVGNPETEAVLEFTVRGGSYRFTNHAVCALCGADMEAKLDGDPVPRGRAFRVRAGQTLTLSFAKNGCRTYLAVAGGIDVPPIMNSKSTYRKCALGGYCGRELRKGDEIFIGEATNVFDATSAIEPRVYANAITVRVIPGPQESAFSETGIRTFFASDYTVTAESDRMGCRLSGSAIESISGTDIISDGMTFGSIQVTGAGLPIVLMADRQTTGGYAKIATVIHEDLPLLAQAMPGTAVRFQKYETVERGGEHD